MGNIRKHPFNEKYPEIYEDMKTLVLGTFPPKMEEEKREFNFYYHHIGKNKFWEILNEVFDEKIFDYNRDNKEIIVKKIINFLRKYKIGICDIIQECRSKDSADKNLEDIKYYDELFDILKGNNLTRIILTSRHNRYKKSAEDFFVDWIEKKHKNDIEWINKIDFIEEHSKLINICKNLDIKYRDLLLRLRTGKIKINNREIEIFVPYSTSGIWYNRCKDSTVIADMYRISFNKKFKE